LTRRRPPCTVLRLLAVRFPFVPWESHLAI
jgi:hypothetical protein